MGISRVLELRIHGIANSPPEETLCTSNEKIERKDGDEQGSFWQVKPSSEDTKHLAPSGNYPDEVEIVTEAYSWGKQARSGGLALALIGRAFVHLAWLLVLPFGLCNLAYWARRDIKGTYEDERWWSGGNGVALVRIFALLQTLFYVIGFVTVFVGQIGLQCFRPPGPDEGESVRVCAGLPGWLDFLAGWSPTARSALFGLVSIAAIFLIYLIGLRARGNFHPDRSFDDEPITRKERKALKWQADRPPQPPLLTTASFWQRPRATQVSERTHLAAAVAFVLFLLATDALLDVTGTEPVELLRHPSLAASEAPFPFWGTVLGGLLLVIAIVIVCASGLTGQVIGDRIKRGYATALLWASALAYAGWCMWAIFFTRDSGGGVGGADHALAGQVVVPTFIAGLGAVIAVASLTWGYHLVLKVVVWVLLGTTIGLVGWAEIVLKNDTERLDQRFWVSIWALAAVALAIAASYTPLLRNDTRVASRTVGWQGNGAAVALLIALFSSLVISTMLVLGVHAWLTRDTETPAVTGYWRSVDGTAAYPIEAPAFYERFAGSLVVMLAVLIVVAVGGAIAALRRFPAFSLPGLMYPEDLTGPALKDQKDRDEYYGGARNLVDPELYWKDRKRVSRRELRRAAHAEPSITTKTTGSRKQLFECSEIPWNEYPTLESKASGRKRTIVEARRLASLAHRGESLMRTLALLTALALVPLAIPAIGEWLDGRLGVEGGSDPQSAVVGPWTSLASASGWVLGLLAIATVAWVVTNAVTSTERPLGIVWDIICFFPRAGHPFTPPCYSERAVPEIKKRIRRFLNEERAAGNEPFVILSAHSMGATIAAAAIFSLYEDEQAEAAEAAEAESRGVAREGEEPTSVLSQIALLTHGVQLRAYFSRFFPEVFGPRVLGIRGTRGPALFRLDPWRKQVIDEAKEDVRTVTVGDKDDPVTLVRLLGGEFRPGRTRRIPRWRSLWRRTDYLGFPVFNYWSKVTGDRENENPIDRGASERSPRSYLWTVARHNDYLSTAQYRAARDELAIMFRQRDPASPDSFALTVPPAESED